MARPPKVRCVEMIPPVRVFGPCNDQPEWHAALEDDGRVELTVDEIEAIRLKDLEGYEQAECANRMNISRGTFQRILVSAHWKVAKALTEGLSLEISGGEYCLTKRSEVCLDCGHTWPVCRKDPQDEDDSVRSSCPKCGGTSISKSDCRASRQAGKGVCCRRRV